MRLTIVALGTRGDVQPVLALGKGLKAAGLAVRVVAGVNFEDWVRSHGFDFTATVDMEAVMRSPAGLRWTQSSHSPLKQLRTMAEILEAHEEAVVTPLLALPSETDLFLTGFTSEPFVQAVSEHSGIPYVNTFLQPYAPTAYGFASMNAPFPRRRSLINRMVSKVAPRLVWSLAAGPANRLRARLGLPAHSGSSYIRATQPTPTLFGFSPYVVPRPDDWPPEKVVSGYWFLDEGADWTPPESLAAFLQAGPIPVYVGFGSMASSDPQATAQLIIDAVERSGERVVVGSGWSRVSGIETPPGVYVLDHAPHDWLFERVAAVVHHGGAGTTAAGLRAGRPTMIVPHMADQPFWGRRVLELGVGVAPVPRHRLTADALADGISRLMNDPIVRANAAALGERIRAEDGVAVAVRQLLLFMQARGL